MNIGVGLTVLFDDPELVDAEPVAAYARAFTSDRLAQLAAGGAANGEEALNVHIAGRLEGVLVPARRLT